MRLALTILLAVLAQHQSMPPGMTHEDHLKQMQKEAELKKRGAAAMGFDQDKTVHHFRTVPSGGSIEVDVVDPADTDSLAQIRSHLREIARAFAAGDFEKPFQTHGEVPPGVPVMQRLKTAIAYTYADTPHGGVVQIRTSNPDAVKGIHEFLRYQTKEHGKHSA